MVAERFAFVVPPVPHLLCFSCSWFIISSPLVLPRLELLAYIVMREVEAIYLMGRMFSVLPHVYFVQL